MQFQTALTRPFVSSVCVENLIFVFPGLTPTIPTMPIRKPLRKPSQPTLMLCMPLPSVQKPCTEGILLPRSFWQRLRISRVHSPKSRLVRQTAGTYLPTAPPMILSVVVSSFCEPALRFFSAYKDTMPNTFQSLVNAFPYWQGQEIGNSTATYLDDLAQAYTRIQEISGSTDAIELWNGETGHPGTGLTPVLLSYTLLIAVVRRIELWKCNRQYRKC